MIQFLTDRVELPELIATRAKELEMWLRKVAAGYGYGVGDLTYILCDDEKILEVNRQFLGHDYYTDVITFDYTTPSRLNGDIYISLDTVSSNAVEAGVTKDEELTRILVHGLLHLTGQADKTPETKAEMTRKENQALSLL
ncbi:MAG: rRNA maturation RNase YbeY [Paludibacteraceae bacterium]|nr:rRNA maturation RNase YbeY [Paludibacteraceae bacterium]